MHPDNLRGARTVHNSTSAEDIRILAERLRQLAEATSLPEYGQLMVKAAFDLEQRAAALDAPGRVVFLPAPVEPNARPLTRSFADDTALLSAS